MVEGADEIPTPYSSNLSVRSELPPGTRRGTWMSALYELSLSETPSPLPPVHSSVPSYPPHLEHSTPGTDQVKDATA